VDRGSTLRTHLCGLPGVPRRALLSLCRRRQRLRALLLRTDAEVLRTAASPTLASPTGSTRPTSVPFWRRLTSCKPAKEIGEERAPSTPAIPSSGVYIILLDVPDRETHGVTPSPTPCGSSDTSPGSSGSVPSTYCVASWSSSRSAIQVLFFLSCLSVCCLWCWFAWGAGALGSIISIYKRNGR